MFQQTVNLKEKMEKERQERLANQFKSTPKEKIVVPPAELELPTKDFGVERSRAEAIDKVYGRIEESKNRLAMQTISRPVIRNNNRFNRWKNYAILVLAVAIIAAGLIIYKNYQDNKIKASSALPEVKWYAVKLGNGDVFYGQIADKTTDPVVMTDVYYDYDQMNKDSSADAGTLPKSEPGNLRLVKRGKEAHGPSGTLDIVRAQVVYMEPLATDSKVLKAILENEK